MCERMLKEAEKKEILFTSLLRGATAVGECFTPVNEQWIEETEAKGWPARKAYDELIRLLGNTGKTWG